MNLNDIKCRDFKCPCGKSYLSYPALFTHIRNKHAGKVIISLIKAPGKIEKPNYLKSTRGRPSLKSKSGK
jgi:hypothetical protein